MMIVLLLIVTSLNAFTKKQFSLPRDQAGLKNKN